MIVEAKEIKTQYDIRYTDSLVKNLIKLITFLYLMTFLSFLYVEFIGTTMRVVNWPDNLLDTMRHILWWVVGIKLFLQLVDGNLNQKKIINILAVLIIGIICSKTTPGYDFVLDVAVLSIGALDVDFNLIIRLYFIVCVIVTIHVMIQSKTGEVQDLIYYRGDRIRDAFGFIYPTDFAAHIFYILCAWTLIRRDKISYLEIFFIFVIAFLLDKYCQARCSVMTVLLLGAVAFALKESRHIDSKAVPYIIKVLFKYMCIIIPWLFSGIIILLGVSSADNRLIRLINKILSDRVIYTRQAFTRYDIKLWGQSIHMVGNGGNVNIPKDVFFIDSSYVNILLRLGLAVFLIVLIGIDIIMIRNSRKLFVLCVLILICLHSLIEHHMFEYYYNFFIILPLADYSKVRNSYKLMRYKTGEIT